MWLHLQGCKTGGATKLECQKQLDTKLWLMPDTCSRGVVSRITCLYAALSQALMFGLAMCAAMSSAATTLCLTSWMLNSGSSHGEPTSRSLAWHVPRCCVLCCFHMMANNLFKV